MEHQLLVELRFDLQKHSLHSWKRLFISQKMYHVFSFVCLGTEKHKQGVELPRVIGKINKSGEVSVHQVYIIGLYVHVLCITYIPHKKTAYLR